MKRALLIIITIILVISTVWVVFNYNKYEIKNVGIQMKPMELIGNWDESLQLYVSPEGDAAYKECTCYPFDTCPDYPPKKNNAYHKYLPSGANGEFIIEVDREFFYYDKIDNAIYQDAVRFYDRLDMMSRRWKLREAFGPPEFPEIPHLSDYVGNNTEVLSEIVDFFRWLGDFFKYVYEILVYLVEYAQYYFTYLEIFFEELLL